MLAIQPPFRNSNKMPEILLGSAQGFLSTLRMLEKELSKLKNPRH
jgi:hypothetical protein